MEVDFQQKTFFANPIEFDQFKKLCNLEGLSVSEELRNLIRTFIKVKTQERKETSKILEN
jgi:hypothetical protein